MTDATPQSPVTPATPRSPLGRRVAAVTVTLLTGLLIWFGAGVLHREVYADRPMNPLDHSCAEGLRRLRGEYELVWARRRVRATSEPGLRGLDDDLRGLRGPCAREGDATRAAFEHLERWRYRAEDQARLWREAVGDEAGQALGAGSSP